MPPARRQLGALGSLQLVGYANNPSKVITELAFIADQRVNNLTDAAFDTPLEVKFNDFMDGVNSRGKTTKTRQRNMTVEQAAAVLLVTVQKGHVELIAKNNDPLTIDVIKILPGAKRILASFLPKLRGYGEIPYDQQYRGAIALAKRHFFPKGKAPTKKELMAMLLQSYEEKRQLSLRQTQTQSTKALGIQTSFIDSSSPTGITSRDSAPGVHTDACTNTVEISDLCNSQSSVELSNNDIVADVKSTAMASELDAGLGNDNDHDVFSEPEPEPVQLVVSTPVAQRSFNPYVTPISNPRHADHAHMAISPSPLDSSLIPVIDSQNEGAFDEGKSTDEDVGELLQATAITQGRLNHCYNQLIATGQPGTTSLKAEKEKLEREFKLAKKLVETEQRLLAANADRSRLSRMVDSLRRQVDWFYSQLGGLLRGMATNAIDNDEWVAYDPELHGGFDPNSI